MVLELAIWKAGRFGYEDDKSDVSLKLRSLLVMDNFLTILVSFTDFARVHTQDLFSKLNGKY